MRKAASSIEKSVRIDTRAYEELFRKALHGTTELERIHVLRLTRYREEACLSRDQRKLGGDWLRTATVSEATDVVCHSGFRLTQFWYRAHRKMTYDVIVLYYRSETHSSW